MELKIAGNIKKLRKSRGLTQEQLAAAFSVTIGAVSKWEAGLSVPDISLILELAAFFNVSTDYLLGYDWQKDSEKQIHERIRDLRNAKRFDEAIAEAEKALQKYPNRFDLVHYCAQLYVVAAVEKKNPLYFERALELYNHTLEMISLNQDPRINEWTIRNDIAHLYMWWGRTDEALEKLKDNNAGNLNCDEIGSILIHNKEQYEEGLSYVSYAMLQSVGKLLYMTNSYVNAYISLKKYDEAVSVCEWMYGILDGLRIPNETSHFDIECVQVLMLLTTVYIYKNDFDSIRDVFKRAYKLGVFFDSAPDFGYTKSKHYYAKDSVTAFDNFGSSAIEGYEEFLKGTGKMKERLLTMWEEVKGELQG